MASRLCLDCEGITDGGTRCDECKAARGREANMARTHGRKGRPWERIRQQVISYAIARGIPCPRCKKPIDPPGTWPDRHPMSPSVDHIDPLSAGRVNGNDPANLRAMHYGCNSARGDGKHERVRRAW